MNDKNINETKQGANRKEMNEIIKRKVGNGSNDFSTGGNGCPARRKLREEILSGKGTNPSLLNGCGEPEPGEY